MADNKCPRCKKSLEESTSRCPHCGFDPAIPLDSTLAVLDRMARTLTRLSTDVQQLRQSLTTVPHTTDESTIADAPSVPRSTASDFSSEKSEVLPSYPSAGEPPKGATPPPLRSSRATQTSDGPKRDKKKKEKKKKVLDAEEIRELRLARELNLGQKWLLIAGIIPSVIGVGLFLKYSFDNNLIGPVGRVAMAYAMGVIFLFIGEWSRRRSYHLFGLYLLGGGIASMYLATYAGFQLYELFSQPFSFFLMILVTLLAGALSLVHDTRWLAVLGLIGGFMTPVMLSTGSANFGVLMSYITILNCGVLWIAFFKQWRLLFNLSFYLTWILYGAWYADHYHDERFWLSLFFCSLFFLIYSLVPIAYHVRSRSDRLALPTVLGILVPNSFISFGFSYAMVKSHFRVEFVSILAILYALVFLFMAQKVYGSTKTSSTPFIVLIGNASLFLVISVPLLFSGHWITFFWSVQLVVVLWLAIRLDRRMLYVMFFLLLLICQFKFMAYDYSSIFKVNIDAFRIRGGYTFKILERYVTTLFVLGSLFISSRMVKKMKKSLGFFSGYDHTILIVWFSIALFFVLNVEVGCFFSSYARAARFSAFSVTWALFSIGLMVVGFIRQSAAMRYSSIGLFAFTLMKVFLLDLAKVSTPYRILSFFVLGMILIGSSYLYHRYKDVLSEGLGNKESR